MDLNYVPASAEQMLAELLALLALPLLVFLETTPCPASWGLRLQQVVFWVSTWLLFGSAHSGLVAMSEMQLDKRHGERVVQFLCVYMHVCICKCVYIYICFSIKAPIIGLCPSQGDCVCN